MLMIAPFSRRKFLQTAAWSLPASILAAAQAQGGVAGLDFTFALLGDLHFDRPGQIRVEPNHSPGTEKEWRAIYERDADGAPLCLCRPSRFCAGARARRRRRLEMFSGTQAKLWRTVDVTQLLRP